MAKKGTKKKMSAPGLDYGLAAAVSDRVAIENVRLISCNCYETPMAGQGKHGLKINCEARAEADKKKGYVLVFPSFKLQAFPVGGKKKEADLLIEATFVLIYKAKNLGGLGEANFDAFGKTNGIYNAWPYWRELVQNTVARMCLPPLTIPVFRLLPPKLKKVKARKVKSEKTTRKEGKSKKRGRGR